MEIVGVLSVGNEQDQHRDKAETAKERQVDGLENVTHTGAHGPCLTCDDQRTGPAYIEKMGQAGR